MPRHYLVWAAAALLAIALLMQGNLGSLAHRLAVYLVQPVAAQAVAVLPAAQHQSEGLPVPLILGYYAAPGSDLSGLQTLEHYRSVLNGIVPDWYTISASGTVGGQADPVVMRFAEQHHLWVFALIQNNADPGVFTRLLENPLSQQRAIDSMLALVQDQGFDGVNLDFEGIIPTDRAAYTAFVRKLSDTLHAYGYYVTLSVPAETADEPMNGWTGAYDYRSLAQASDLMMIMAYDEHSANSAAGPVASTSWVNQVVHYAASTIPLSKLVLGIPTYGYDWSGTSQATALTFQQWAGLIDRYGGNLRTTVHLQYWQGGALHQAWYEALTAFQQKVRLAVGYDLRGIVLWRLGIEDPAIWNLVQQ